MYSMRTLLCTSTNVWKVTYICCSEPLTASSDGTNDLRCTQPGSITRCKKHAAHRVHHKLHRHMVFLCAMLLPYICVHKSARRWALCTRTVVFLEIHIDLGHFTNIYRQFPWYPSGRIGRLSRHFLTKIPKIWLFKDSFYPANPQNDQISTIRRKNRGIPQEGDSVWRVRVPAPKVLTGLEV